MVTQIVPPRQPMEVLVEELVLTRAVVEKSLEMGEVMVVMVVLLAEALVVEIMGMDKELPQEHGGMEPCMQEAAVEETDMAPTMDIHPEPEGLGAEEMERWVEELALMAQQILVEELGVAVSREEVELVAQVLYCSMSTKIIRR